ncbi:hypothetical protein, partial [Streptomyces baarnensis]|uniref:hypothetical protein n=1 Tax=Streptomyces baarnensis TaxID=66872 RepID=UPI0004ABC81C
AGGGRGGGRAGDGGRTDRPLERTTRATGITRPTGATGGTGPHQGVLTEQGRDGLIGVRCRSGA